MSERDALLRAIIDRPADDLPRLVYADWLDEHGESERAKFIRLQCEISNPVGACDRTGEEIGRNKLYRFRCRCRPCSLRRRELEMLGVHSPQGCLWKDAGVEASQDFSPHEHIGDPALPVIPRESRILSHSWNISGYVGSTADYCRGFVTEIRLPLVAFAGEACERCGGRGYTTIDRTEDDPTIRETECSECSRTGQTGGCAAAIFREHPVECVVLTDREPEFYAGEPEWVWHTTDASLDRDDLPFGLWELLTSFSFSSRQAALDALSAACIVYGRLLAFPMTAPAKK